MVLLAVVATCDRVLTAPSYLPGEVRSLRAGADPIPGCYVVVFMVHLGWTDGSTNETQFRIRRSIRNPEGTYPPYTQVATRSAAVTAYRDTTAVAGRIHRYYVQACNASGCSNSPIVSVTVPAS